MIFKLRENDNIDEGEFTSLEIMIYFIISFDFDELLLAMYVNALYRNY